IKLGECNFLRGLRIEHPERSTGDRIIPYFFHMLVAENQRRRGFLLWLSRTCFDVGLQSVDLSAQRLNVAPQSALLRRWSGVRGSLIRGIRILIFVFRVIERRILVAVIAVGIIGSVRVKTPSSVKAAMMLVGVSSSKMNAGAATKTAAVKRARGVYGRGASGKTAMRGEVGAATAEVSATADVPAAAAAMLCPHRQREQNQAKRRYGQPAPHTT